MAEVAPVLSLRGLSVAFRTERGPARAVESVDLDLFPGETLGLVGESGCGKSVTSLATMRLLPQGSAIGGQVLLDGEDLLALPEAAMRRVRGDRVAMIYQEPMTALNPVHPVGEQIAEVVRLHRGLSRSRAAEEAVAALRTVGIALPERRALDYPHQMSGGMRQRVMIAMALACRPRVLIADEPTTALDVTIQAQILDLIARLRAELGMAMLLITHDLGVVAEVCDQVAVMYAGRIVEEAPVNDLFARPLHPYTRGLIASVPSLDRPQGALHAIPGTVPGPLDRPAGCAFRSRCPVALPRCGAEAPSLLADASGRRVACFAAGQP